MAAIYILENTALKRAALDGTGLTTMISSRLSIPTSLDVTAEHIYIGDTAARRPRVARWNLPRGGGFRNLISGVLPRSLAVTAQHVYILEATALKRASLDGTGLTTLISSGLTRAWSLAVTAQHVYILEPTALKRAALDGTGLTTLISSGLSSAFSLAVVVANPAVARAGVPRTRADPFEAIASAGLPRARARAVVLRKHEAYARAGVPSARAAGTIVLPELPPGRWDGLYSPPAMRALVDGVVRALDAEPRAQPLWGEVDPSVLPHLAWYWAAIAYDIEGDVDQQRAAVDAAKRLTVEIGTEAALATAGAINRATVTLRYLAETHEGTPWPRRKDVEVAVRAPLDVEIVDLYREYWTRLAEACLPHTLQLRGVDVSY